MKRLAIIFAWIGFIFSVCGCQSFSGDIAFQNESSREVWVDRVEGFKRQPPCGILIPGATKASMMGSMELPEEVFLFWSHDLHKADKRSVVVLRDIRPPSSRAELQIVLTSQQTWIARWKERPQ